MKKVFIKKSFKANIDRQQTTTADNDDPQICNTISSAQMAFSQQS